MTAVLTIVYYVAFALIGALSSVLPVIGPAFAGWFISNTGRSIAAALDRLLPFIFGVGLGSTLFPWVSVLWDGIPVLSILSGGAAFMCLRLLRENKPFAGHVEE